MTGGTDSRGRPVEDPGPGAVSGLLSRSAPTAISARGPDDPHADPRCAAWGSSFPGLCPRPQACALASRRRRSERVNAHSWHLERSA